MLEGLKRSKLLRLVLGGSAAGVGTAAAGPLLAGQAHPPDVHPIALGGPSGTGVALDVERATVQVQADTSVLADPLDTAGAAAPADTPGSPDATANTAAGADTNTPQVAPAQDRVATPDTVATAARTADTAARTADTASRTRAADSASKSGRSGHGGKGS